MGGGYNAAKGSRKYHKVDLVLVSASPYALKGQKNTF